MVSFMLLVERFHFKNEYLIENIKAVHEAVLKARPASVKGSLL